MKEYQKDFSKINTAMFHQESRLQKARTILAVLRDFYPKEFLVEATLADIGCSTGIILNFLADYIKEAVGFDIDKGAIGFAQHNYQNHKIRFQEGDALKIPLASETTDIVICGHVYEHVPDQEKLVSEIYRILKRGGICYFIARNKYTIMEAHYHLPFLAWLPKRAAH